MFRHFTKISTMIVGLITIMLVFLCEGIIGNKVFAYGGTHTTSSSGGFLFIVSLLLIVAGIFVTTKTKGKSKTNADQIENKDDWKEVMSSAGYAYDKKQDIVYSKKDAWQRNMGYCRLYDEAAAPLNMIIDCEPIYFEYNNKRWLIEFWKGQYGMATGCEVGIYNTQGPDIDIPGTFKGTFYHAAKDNEMLQVSVTLKKGNKKILARVEKHWWLTAFIVGEFSEPSELILNVGITLSSSEMRDKYVEGLINAGYKKEDITIKKGNYVVVRFDNPHSPQPLSRIKATDWVIQRKNKLLCDQYQEMTTGYDRFPDKINVIQQKSPGLYNTIMTLGKPKLLFSSFEDIKQHL